MSAEIIASWVGYFAYAAIPLALVAAALYVPLPEDIVLLVSGYIASQGVLKIWWVLVAAFVGVLLADNVGFWLGRHGGGWLRRFVKKELFTKLQGYYRVRGPLVVFASRFTIGFRNLFHLAAGASNLPWKKFIVFDALGALVSVPLVTMTGYLFGTYFENIIRVVTNIDRTIGFIVLIVFVALAVFVCVYRIHLKHKITHGWVNGRVKKMLAKTWYYRLRQ